MRWVGARIMAAMGSFGSPSLRANAQPRVPLVVEDPPNEEPHDVENVDPNHLQPNKRRLQNVGTKS